MMHSNARNIAHFKRTSNHNCPLFSVSGFSNIAHFKRTSNHNLHGTMLSMPLNIAHFKRTSNHNRLSTSVSIPANISHFKKTSNHWQDACWWIFSSLEHAQFFTKLLLRFFPFASQKEKAYIKRFEKGWGVQGGRKKLSSKVFPFPRPQDCGKAVNHTTRDRRKNNHRNGTPAGRIKVQKNTVQQKSRAP